MLQELVAFELMVGTGVTWMVGWFGMIVPY